MTHVVKKVFHMFGADHRDRDGLNNRRSNLRSATGSLNQANRRKAAGTSSRFKGVTWDRRRSTWISQIGHQRQHFQLGRTEDEWLAAARYDVAARALFGEFSTSNLGVSWGEVPAPSTAEVQP